MEWFIYYLLVSLFIFVSASYMWWYLGQDIEVRYLILLLVTSLVPIVNLLWFFYICFETIKSFNLPSKVLFKGRKRG